MNNVGLKSTTIYSLYKCGLVDQSNYVAVPSNELYTSRRVLT